MANTGDESSMFCSSQLYKINVLSLQTRQTSKMTDSSEVQESVLQWFENKGIRKSQPEELINNHKNHLKIKVGMKIRKMSAPSENSMLLQRRAREVISVYV